MKNKFIILVLTFLFLTLFSCVFKDDEKYCEECGGKIYNVFNYYEKSKYKIYRLPSKQIYFVDEVIIMKSKEDVLRIDNTGEILRTFVTKNYEGYFKKNSLILIHCKDIEIMSIKQMTFDENELTILLIGSKEETYNDFVCVIEISNLDLRKVDYINVKNFDK